MAGTSHPQPTVALSAGGGTVAQPAGRGLNGSSAIWPGGRSLSDATLRLRVARSFERSFVLLVGGRLFNRLRSPDARSARLRTIGSVARRFGRYLRLARTCAPSLDERRSIERLAVLPCVRPSGHGRDLLIGQNPCDVLDRTGERCTKERANLLPALFAFGLAEQLFREIVRSRRDVCHFPSLRGGRLHRISMNVRSLIVCCVRVKNSRTMGHERSFDRLAFVRSLSARATLSRKQTRHVLSPLTTPPRPPDGVCADCYIGPPRPCQIFSKKESYVSPCSVRAGAPTG